MRVSAQKKAASASRQAALKKQVVLVHREELEQQQRAVDAPPVPQVLPTERLLHHDTAAAVPRPVQQKAARPKQQGAATPTPVVAEASVDALPPKKAKKTADVDEEPTTDWYKIRR
jgi:hypothetical protein